MSCSHSLDQSGGPQQVSFGLGASTVDFSTPPLNTRTTTSITQACSNTGLVGSAAMVARTECLQTKGSFQWSSSRRVVTANFLNTYSPRLHSAVSALTRLMRDTNMVRFSVLTFSPEGSVVGTGQWEGLNTKLHIPFGPACSEYGDFVTYSMRQNDVIRQVQRGLRTTFDAPLTSAHYAAGSYFRSTLVEPFSGWFGTYPTDADFNEGTGADKTGCFDCDVNAIVLLTASAPSEPGLNLPEEISTLPTPCVDCGFYAAEQGTPPGGEASHVHRVADWLRNHDLRLDRPGVQQVPTYAIGLGMTDPEAINLLKATMSAGGRHVPERHHHRALQRPRRGHLRGR